MRRRPGSDEPQAEPERISAASDSRVEIEEDIRSARTAGRDCRLIVRRVRGRRVLAGEELVQPKLPGDRGGIP